MQTMNAAPSSLQKQFQRSASNLSSFLRTR